MGALHFLMHDDSGALRLAGDAPNQGPHCVELFELAGTGYMRLTLGANNPGGGGIEITLPLTGPQCRALAEGAERLAHRIHG